MPDKRKERGGPETGKREKNLAKLRMLFASANLLKYAWAGCPDWKPAE
jgi:hypothetical protein